MPSLNKLLEFALQVQVDLKDLQLVLLQQSIVDFLCLCTLLVFGTLLGILVALLVARDQIG